MSVNAAAGIQPKLMEYYVLNPQQFKDKFGKSNAFTLFMDKSSQFFKFDTFITPICKEIPANHLSALDYLKVGPWLHELMIRFHFYQSETSEGTIMLDYHFQSEFKTQIKELNAMINLSMKNKDEVPEELRWNEFNFKFAKFERFNYSMQGKIPFETGRPHDVKKLWTREDNTLVRFTFEIRFSDEFLFKKRFQEDISWISHFPPFSAFEKSGDFIEITTDSEDSEVYQFDKNDLIRISPVFAAMMQNPKNKEVQENKLIFKGERLSVIRNLRSLLDLFWFPKFTASSDWDTDLDLDPDPVHHLMIFADKYDIKSLYKICSEHIGNHLDNENVLKALKVSDLVNDEKLFEKAMKRFLATKEDEVRKCFLRHPEMVAEMMDLAIVYEY